MNQEAAAAAEEAVSAKHMVYDKWDISKEHVIPMAFTVHGAWAKVTWDFLNTMAFTMSRRNLKRKAEIMRRFREAIGVAIVLGHARVILEFNRINGGRAMFSGLGAASA